MAKKLLPLIVVIVILVGLGSFYGGMKYGQNQDAANRRGTANFQNLTPEQQQQMAQRFGNGFNGRNGSNLSNGEIIAKDDKSITVKLRDGGSKIIFYSETTEISKFASGATSDLEIGKTITVNGTANQDGSITARSIQIRPEIPNQPVNQ